ncbi:hypothetical protein IW261DRAFT_1499947 [Armillaria novae-zelandiae]|uniref:Uncharacterized protein n=1 Tax=Armillaria novae-zelandiae TaxID=153914 RepID=A0AA39NYL2_9AGAR|nr:hypothetical protein IW261DRAFT_1499947 [Armillaria novae-zelandiae]
MIPKCILTVFYMAVIASADVDEKTDEELLDQCISVPRDEWDASSCPHRLTPDVLVKVVCGFTAGWPSEVLAQDLVKNHTNIPVPPIRCIMKVDSSQSIIVMDFIPRITLAAAWPTMGFWQKIRIAFTLRSYPGRCYASHIFGPIKSVKGPFATSAEFIKLFNNAMDVAALARLSMHQGPLPDDGTLDGQLWLIDFATAGFYPRWFEYVNMVIDVRCEGGPEYDSMWWAIIPFVTDLYFHIYDWVSRVSLECL